MNTIIRDGSKDVFPPKMELPVTIANSFIAINVWERVAAQLSQKPGSGTVYHNIIMKYSQECFIGL